MKQCKMLAICGSSGSGKTITSIKLAKFLESKKKNVIVVFLDTMAPVIPYILPSDIEHTVSLGELLTKPTLSQKDILTACVSIKNHDYISFLGYKLGESKFNYPRVIESKAVDFFIQLKHIADYIIVDFGTSIEEDIAAKISLKLADEVIRLITPNMKGVSYCYTLDGFLSDNNYKRNVFALSNIKEDDEWQVIAGQYKEVKYYFPYCKELEQQINEVELLAGLKTKEGRIYTDSIENAAKDIFNLEDEPKVEKRKKEAKNKKQDKQEKLKEKKEKKSFVNLFKLKKGDF